MVNTIKGLEMQELKSNWEKANSPLIKNSACISKSTMEMAWDMYELQCDNVSWHG